MKFSSIFWGLVASVVSTVAWADASNVLVTFSTVGPDCYADGKQANREWYALCWSPTASFGGITSDCTAAAPGQKVLRLTKSRLDGRCGTTVFQFARGEVPVGGKYFLFLLDTRDLNGAVSAAGADGKPVFVNGAVPTTASAEVPSGAVAAGVTVTDAALQTVGSLPAWSESEVDGATVAQPRIAAFAIEGDQAVITVSGLHASVRYNIFTGAQPDAVEATTLTLPISAESNEATFYIPKDRGRFFKVSRQPLK